MPENSASPQRFIGLDISSRKIPPTRRFLRFAANRLGPLLFQLLETPARMMAKPIQLLQPSLGF
jgi:hypothetical protein